MHEVLVNRLGGLSLPRKSVVRLTDRPDMPLDVYRGRKTTIQYNQPVSRSLSVGEILVNEQITQISWPVSFDTIQYNTIFITLLYQGRKTCVNSCRLTIITYNFQIK